MSSSRTDRRVVLTGLGLVLPGCDDRRSFWRQVSEGESQLTLEPDPTDGSRRFPAGVVRDLDATSALAAFPPEIWSRCPREVLMYLVSIARAGVDADLPIAGWRGDRIGLFDGVARPAFAYWYGRIRAEERGERYGRGDLNAGLPGQAAGTAAALFNVTGPVYTYTSTCSSGSIAIGHALRAILAGDCDVAFAGGHESSLVAPLVAMYRDANLLTSEDQEARRAIAPYSGASANAFGEGAVTLVLESREHAERRGARVLADLAGYRYRNNGYHPTRVDAVGIRPSEVIEELLREAGLSADEVDFVVGHGNGVRTSDASEENYMRRVFGARAAEVPLVSTKPIYGHTLGASSAVNAAAAALMVQNDFVIPTINLDPARRRRFAWHQPGVGAPHRCEAGIATSYGMGGHNTALLFLKHEREAA